MMYFRIQYALYALLYLVFTVYTAPTFAKIIYKVDRAIDAADLIVLGEIYKVEMVDHAGSPIMEKKTFATKENKYKIKNYIRIVEKIYGEDVGHKELIIDRPTPAYYGKEALREGMKLFYFLKKDGTPINGEYEFNIDRRPRITKMLKKKMN